MTWHRLTLFVEKSGYKTQVPEEVKLPPAPPSLQWTPPFGFEGGRPKSVTVAWSTTDEVPMTITFTVVLVGSGPALDEVVEGAC